MDTWTERDPAATDRSWAPLLAVALGYFMVILDATAVNLALPAVSRDLGGGITGLQWVADGYTLAFAALLLSAGVAGDRFGPRRSLVSGQVGFVPRLRLALAGCGGAFLLGGIVTLAAMGRAAAHPVTGGCGPAGLPTPSTAAGTRAGSRTARSAG